MIEGYIASSAAELAKIGAHIDKKIIFQISTCVDVIKIYNKKFTKNLAVTAKRCNLEVRTDF
jgi:hypothetical protein